MGISLLILLPCHNDHPTLPSVLDDIALVSPELQKEWGIEISVLVIDDGSSPAISLPTTDPTYTMIRHPKQLGLGAAVRTGFLYAKHHQIDYVIKLDTDGQHDPRDVKAIIKALLDGADIVYGERRFSKDYKPTKIRKWGNWFFTGLMKRLTRYPLLDGQPGMIGINHRYLQVFKLPGNYNYAQQVLLESSLNQLKFAHVPIQFLPRKWGKSFIGPLYPIKVFWQLGLVYRNAAS